MEIYWKLKGGLDRTLCRTRLGRGLWPCPKNELHNFELIHQVSSLHSITGGTATRRCVTTTS